MLFICCLKYFLSRALAAILAGKAESFGHFFRSLRITAAEVVVILWVHRYKIFNFFSHFLYFY